MEIEALGPVMALTRNHACVHVKTGVYRKGEMMPEASMGLFNDEEIEIRFFFRSCGAVVFVVDESRTSLQCFVKEGGCVVKLYEVVDTARIAMQWPVEA